MAIAKTTRPRFDGVVPRPRLYRLLDRCGSQPLTWVTGPPGAGKTTLVTSYLKSRRLRTLWYQVDAGDADVATFFFYLGAAAPRGRPLPLLTAEYRRGLPIFTRNLFRDLFSRLGKRFALVLDNYQDLPPDALVHEVLRDALREVPPGGRVLVLSRGQPPRTLARLHAERALGVLDWPRLRLTPREARALIQRLGGRRVPRAAVRPLCAAADGWAAGLVLLVGHTRRDHVPRRPSAAWVPEVLFDYFAGELFDRMDAGSQELLLQVAWLPTLTGAVAEALTESPDAGRLLAELARSHYFTNRHGDAEPVFQLHPLFREFLRARACVAFAPPRLRAVQRRAADLLAAAGRVEEAASLLGEASGWDALTALIQAHAAAFVAQGRAATVEGWLSILPDASLSGDPWLLFWQGACRVPSDPAASRAVFESALGLFRARREPEGAFLAWAAAVDTFVHENHDFAPLDEWIATFDDLLRELPQPLSPAVEARVTVSMATALVFRQPGHPELEHWAARTRLLAETTDPGLRVQALFSVLHYLILIGDQKQLAIEAQAIQQVLDNADMPPFMRVLSLFGLSLCQSVTDSFAACRKTVATGLALARRPGIRALVPQFLGNRIVCELSEGDIETAGRSLRAMAREVEGATRYHQGFHQFLETWHALAERDFVRAQAHAARMDSCGIPVVEAAIRRMAAHVAHERGDEEAAQTHLARALVVSRDEKVLFAGFGAGLLEAHMALERGDERAGLEALARALSVGARGGLIGWPLLPRVIVRLCVKALEAGIEVDYVRSLVRRHKLVPDIPPLSLESWPWVVRIRTLGRFELARDDTPVVFAGKVQRRPLALLKALIALGGHCVSEARVADLLWPDADGDRAHRALAMALHRLRRLLGTEQAVTRRDGLLGLDPRYCWVDVWAFGHAFAAAETDGGDGERLSRSETNLEALYRGTFLAEEGTPPWAAPLADRLRHQWLRHLDRVADRRLRAGRPDAAIDAYSRALEVEPATEHLYRRLMEVYHRLGRRHEALQVYERCCRTLAALLNAPPSPETRSLHEAVRTSSPRPK